MSDEERAEQGQGSKWRRPRATLESLGDITISGRFAINLRILLEPIGFLRIILIVSLNYYANIISDRGPEHKILIGIFNILCSN